MERLPSWMEVVKPDPIVLSERLEESLFAADLYSVLKGTAPREYQDPRRFAEQTYPTEDMVQLISDVVRRLSGKGSSNPVIQIQTPFGGGKTHTLIALYHLVKHGREIRNSLLGEMVFEKVGISSFPEAKVAVFVGTVPNPEESPTPWGEIARQLGRYDVVRRADEGRYSPGRELLEKVIGNEPTLILMDEVAEFAAKCGQDYYTQFLAFCQELTETVNSLKRCCLVVTLPSSAPYGERGERALRDLLQIFGRMQATYEPVRGMEIYEIIRKRLFEMDNDWEEDAYRIVDEYISAYRQWSDAPEWAQSEEYRERMLRAYPFHPLLIDWLIERWGSFHTFQRTRGALRFLGHIVQDIWRKYEKEPQKAPPLIQPSHVNLTKPEIAGELMKHIDPGHRAVIHADIQERAPRIDSGMGDWSQYRVATGLATSIFLASFTAAEERQPGATLSELKIAVWQPGLEPAVIPGTMTSLDKTLLYLHEENGLYFFSLQPSLVRLKIDFIERVPADEIRKELERRLKELVKESGDWQVRITDKAEDVPDTRDLQMVVLPPETPIEEATQKVQKIFETKGANPRIYRNALVVVAADRNGKESAERQVKEFLALERIESSEERKRLSPRDQQRLKEDKENAGEESSRELCNAYRIVFKQTEEGLERLDMGTMSIGESLNLVKRVQNFLHRQDLLMTEKVNPAQVKELMGDAKEKALEDIWQDYGKFPRLPILLKRGVLAEAVRMGVRQKLFAVRIDDREYYGEELPSGSDWVKYAVLLSEPTGKPEVPQHIRPTTPVGTVGVEDILGALQGTSEARVKEIYDQIWSQKRSEFRSEAEFREAFRNAIERGRDQGLWELRIGKTPVVGEGIDMSTLLDRGTIHLKKAPVVPPGVPQPKVISVRLVIPSEKFGTFARSMANLHQLQLVGDHVEISFKTPPLRDEQRRQLKNALQETISQIGGEIQEPTEWK
jgi:predicted AAA+ superfamily ATPase